jgi:hypothetical protein
MTYAKGAARLLRKTRLHPEAATVALRRLEEAVPNLVFGNWSVRSVAVADTEGFVTWDGNQRRSVSITIRCTAGTLPAMANQSSLTFRVKCSRPNDLTVSPETYRFLNTLAGELAGALDAAVRSGFVSVVDFGARSVAKELRERGGLGFDPLPVLQFVRSLGHETYENQRVPYGLILTTRTDGSAPISLAFDNKRFKHVTDGFSTALMLDAKGYVIGLTCLQAPDKEGTARTRRPWWTAGLAVESERLEGIGVALTRNGDILVVHRGVLAFSQRAGKWRQWDHSANIRLLNDAWDFSGNPQQITEVLSYLYHVALDLSFRRSGGLLVAVGSEARLRSLLTSRNDMLTSSRRKEPERSLDRSLAGRAIFRNDRRITADLASLDGALAVDRTGRLLAYGAMTKSSKSAHQGARTRAAMAAGREGVAIKISSDGDIGFFRGGKKLFEI